MKRVKFAREVQTTFEDDFRKHKVCFYLDGVIFRYKKNPVDDARSLHSKIWRKRNGLDPGCVAKGSHTGSGGRTVNMIVVILYMKGVIFCEYQKLDGDYIALIFYFRKILRKSGKRNSKLFVHDNCPVFNCAKARQAL